MGVAISSILKPQIPGKWQIQRHPQTQGNGKTFLWSVCGCSYRGSLTRLLVQLYAIASSSCSLYTINTWRMLCFLQPRAQSTWPQLFCSLIYLLDTPVRSIPGDHATITYRSVNKLEESVLLCGSWRWNSRFSQMPLPMDPPLQSSAELQILHAAKVVNSKGLYDQDNMACENCTFQIGSLQSGRIWCSLLVSIGTAHT